MSVLIVNKNNFDSVRASEKTVLLDFYADWCGPCKMQAPVFDALAGELDGKVIFGKVNVDEEAALALKYQVMSIPTIVVMQYGIFRTKAIGVQTRENLLELLKSCEDGEN